MLQRISISIDGEGLRRLEALQRRFGARSRSEAFRELVKRYERLERGRSALNRCVQGYLAQPEPPSAESGAILRSAIKGQRRSS